MTSDFLWKLSCQIWKLHIPKKLYKYREQFCPVSIIISACQVAPFIGATL
ncbi:MAG: hypothetical protein ACLTER_11290 [Ruminococcus sp.]